MKIKCVNGYLYFTFSDITEYEKLGNLLPIPDLVPVNDSAFTFIPKAQADLRYIIANTPINRITIPTKSNSDVIMGFKENGLTYSFVNDAIIPTALVNQKVELTMNGFGLYFGTFMLQPYSRVGFSGIVTDYECEYSLNTGMFVYDYIRFEL